MKISKTKNWEVAQIVNKRPCNVVFPSATLKYKV